MSIHERILTTPLAVDARGSSVRVVVAGDKYTVANISTGMNDREGYAQLFAKSADLLLALRRLVECPDLNLDTMEPETRVAVDQANAALFGLDNDVPSGAMTPPQFSPREAATVLAALRYWQQNALRADERTTQDDIATDNGTLSLMQPAEIDALCERINS